MTRPKAVATCLLIVASLALTTALQIGPPVSASGSRYSYPQAGGAILYEENFSEYASGTHPAGWTVPYCSGSKCSEPQQCINWVVEKGWYASPGAYCSPQPKTGLEYTFYTQQTFTNFIATVTFEGVPKCINPEGAPVMYLIARGQANGSYTGYYFGNDVRDMKITVLTPKTRLLAVMGGTPAPNYAYGVPEQIKVMVNGTDLQYWLTTGNGKAYHLETHDSTYSEGHIGLGVYNCFEQYTDLVVSSLP